MVGEGGGGLGGECAGWDGRSAFHGGMIQGDECVREPLGIVSAFDRGRAAWFMASLSARARDFCGIQRVRTDKGQQTSECNRHRRTRKPP